MNYGKKKKHPTMLHKKSSKIFTGAVLLIFSVNLGYAALNANSKNQPSSNSLGEGEILGSFKIDNSKVYHPDLEELKKTLPQTAEVKILDLKKRESAIRDHISISTGLNYLSQAQATNGSWSENGKISFLSTIAVVDLLNRLNHKVGENTPEQLQIESMLSSALENLETNFPENNDHLAQKVEVLEQAGSDVSDLMDYLVAQINESALGFGLKKNYSPSITTTARVLKAISVVSYQDPGADRQFTTKAALLYLLNSQNIDGGWPEVFGEPSSLFTTNLVLESLRPYQNTVIQGLPNGSLVIPTRINHGFNYLKNFQSFNGSWQDNILLTALAYDNYLSYEKVSNFHQNAINYLKNNQNPNGSYGSSASIFSTAKALKALVQPDIEVTNIQNISGHTPDQSTVLQINIRNSGSLNSNPINLSALPAQLFLYIDSVGINLNFAGLPETILLEPDSELILQITIFESLFGEHSVKFKVDHQGPEFSKTNNEFTKPIAFDSSTFNGPKPPPWLGASTNPNPGTITLRWQASPESRAYYNIYISNIPSVYDPNLPALTNIIPNANGLSVDINPTYWNAPLYFTIVSVDGNGMRGNYSPESWATAYTNPENYRGQTSGLVFNSLTNKNIPNATLEFFLITNWLTQNGNFDINYYPGFYLNTTYASGYYSKVQSVQIIASGNTAYDFALTPLNSGSIPPPISGLNITPSSHQIRLDWNTYSPPANFKQFNIHRSNLNFGSPTPSNIIASVTSTSATSFIDTNVINGLRYFYTVSVENQEGNLSNAEVSGAYEPNSPPFISNLNVAQEKNNLNISYNLADEENNSTLISFELWNGASWQTMNSVVGAGEQMPGENKIAIWNAKVGLPNFNNTVKIKILGNDSHSVNPTSSLVSVNFNLDTLNPSIPVFSFHSPTIQTKQEISGTKEAGSGIKLSNQEIVAVNSSTGWTYDLTLNSGLNTFNLISFDAFLNESTLKNFEIESNSTAYICGDPDRNSQVDITDAVYLINYIFGGGPSPFPFLSGDADNNNQVDITDAVYLINYIFGDGPAPCVASLNPAIFSNWTQNDLENYLKRLKLDYLANQPSEQ